MKVGDLVRVQVEKSQFSGLRGQVIAINPKAILPYMVRIPPSEATGHREITSHFYEAELQPVDIGSGEGRTVLR